MSKRYSDYPFRLFPTLLICTLMICFSGCGGFKIVRIPIPVPVFGFGKKTERPPERTQPSPAEIRPGEKVGKASWYGRQFHGRTTASGERFDMYKLTAAHRTLPFGTKVRVTNIENGKSVIVRINDRGPWIDDIIIDVSREAARRLGFINQGVTQVKLELL